jgi:hypothetical protein
MAAPFTNASRLAEAQSLPFALTWSRCQSPGIESEADANPRHRRPIDNPRAEGKHSNCIELP